MWPSNRPGECYFAHCLTVSAIQRAHVSNTGYTKRVPCPSKGLARTEEETTSRISRFCSSANMTVKRNTKVHTLDTSRNDCCSSACILLARSWHYNQKISIQYPQVLQFSPRTKSTFLNKFVLLCRWDFRGSTTWVARRSEIDIRALHTASVSSNKVFHTINTDLTGKTEHCLHRQVITSHQKASRWFYMESNQITVACHRENRSRHDSQPVTKHATNYINKQEPADANHRGTVHIYSTQVASPTFNSHCYMYVIQANYQEEYI